MGDGFAMGSVNETYNSQQYARGSGFDLFLEQSWFYCCGCLGWICLIEVEFVVGILALQILAKSF